MNHLYFKYAFLSVFIFLNTSYAFAHIPAENVFETTTHTIEMDDTEFSVTELVVSQGDTIVFKNIGQKEHWPASNLHPTHEVYPEFDSRAEVKPGDSWSFVFTRPGIWRFHDHLVPTITGSIEVIPVSNSTSQEEESHTTLRDITMTIWKDIRARLFIFYYIFFPNEQEVKIASINVFELVKNEEELDFWLTVFGADVLMDKLVTESVTVTGQRINCHLQTHKIGLRSYTLFGADALQSENNQCNSGYLHGVFAGFLAEEGTGNVAEKIELFCSELDTTYAQHMCFHGMGHAMTAYEDFNLPKVIEFCRTLEKDNQVSCLGGVVMENVETGKGNGIFSDHKTPWLSLDPHFPCSDSLFANDAQLTSICYGMQSSWMLALYKNNITKVIDECHRALPDGMLACFEGVGRDAAGLSNYVPKKVAGSCEQIGDTDSYNRCIRGALFPILNFSNIGMRDEGSRFCDVVRESSKTYCYEALRLRINNYFTHPSDLLRICSTFAPQYQYLCDDLK